MWVQMTLGDAVTYEGFAMLLCTARISTLAIELEKETQESLGLAITSFCLKVIHITLLTLGPWLAKDV